jgi:hypothetical protein
VVSPASAIVDEFGQPFVSASIMVVLLDVIFWLRGGRLLAALFSPVRYWCAARVSPSTACG